MTELKTGDKICTYRSTWARRMETPWVATVVAEHGKRDITIKHAGREERMTRTQAAKRGWCVMTDDDRARLQLHRVRIQAERMLGDALHRVRESRDVDDLAALVVALGPWAGDDT